MLVPLKDHNDESPSGFPYAVECDDNSGIGFVRTFNGLDGKPYATVAVYDSFDAEYRGSLKISAEIGAVPLYVYRMLHCWEMETESEILKLIHRDVDPSATWIIEEK